MIQQLKLDFTRAIGGQTLDYHDFREANRIFKPLSPPSQFNSHAGGVIYYSRWRVASVKTIWDHSEFLFHKCLFHTYKNKYLTFNHIL